MLCKQWMKEYQEIPEKVLSASQEFSVISIVNLQENMPAMHLTPSITFT